MATDETNAWAVWNDCQGIFPDAVFHERKDAITALPEYGEGAKVVPIVMCVDPGDHGFRHWQEDDAEKWR